MGKLGATEALLFGALIFSPRLITLAVAVRDLRQWREARLTARARRRSRLDRTDNAEPAPFA